VVNAAGVARIRRRLLGLLLVTHPIPSAMYVVAVGLFSALAADASHRSLSLSRLVLVLAGVACAQMAIGSTNDYRDRDLDRVSRPEKPIVRGLISSRDALMLALFATGGVLAFMAPLGVLPFILGICVEGLGLAYDLGLKGTVFSAFLYAVYFPLIPLLAWAVFGKWQPFLPWLLPVGALLGVAMNVANSLPDVEQDRLAGVSGLPHMLGPRWALAVAWGLPLVALALLWALDGIGVVPSRLPSLVAASAIGLAASAGAAGLYVWKPSPATLRKTFIVQALGVVGLATGWLAAVAF